MTEAELAAIKARVAACETKAARTAWQSTEAMQLIREDM